MEIRNLYRQGNRFTLQEPEGDYVLWYRLIAAEGMAVSDGDTVAPAIDVESKEGWSEIPAPQEPVEELEELREYYTRTQAVLPG